MTYRGWTEEQVREVARRRVADGDRWPVRLWLVSAGEPELRLWVLEDGTITQEQR